MAEEDLISKKELLTKFGISYGALYRWKRKGLIPEEWFIRKATPTGQETFFARKAVCERVEAIIKMRDEENIPLEKMAEIFYPKKETTKNLVITGKYGKHVFDISELNSVTIESSDGKKVEIIERIKETEL